ncbi:hypothetical protein SAZ10_14080 [Mesorhizobium sp. BAC0120]|uniref:hypothetical protein n=1 Tax=Mesorhizobium sp. BAC0120 TaxID=3090670 RepID=UPI00298C5C86|nr:hypothetical protein [Mesorhizobium sp. BAC0120]MDW6022888.1 hypothetical protein [Mesorhizobium sp. BAC0120]
MRSLPRWHLPFAFVLLWLLSVFSASAAEPIVRARVETQGSIVVGQQVVVSVDVLVPNFFMSSPKFPQFDLPNAVVTLQDNAMNLVETIDSVTYAGIRRTYLVTPQAAGDFVLPQVPITFSYAAVPGQPPASGSVTVPPEKFTVAGVPGASAGAGSAIAAKLAVAQALDRDLKGIKVGDTLVRTVSVTAEGMQAMMIPAPDFTAPDGVRIYRQDPVLSDGTPQGQGSAEGKRIDRVTYAFERPGNYVLPAVEIGWYDPATQKRQVAQVREIAVTVGEHTAFKPAIAPPAAPKQAGPPGYTKWLQLLSWVAGAALTLALLAWLGARAWPRIKSRREQRRIARENSEATYFRRVEVACRLGDLRAAYAALDAWGRRANIGSVPKWLLEFGGPGACEEFERFERATFGSDRGAQHRDSHDLSGALSKARSTWLKRARGRSATASAAGALPKLNP